MLVAKRNFWMELSSNLLERICEWRNLKNVSYKVINQFVLSKLENVTSLIPELPEQLILISSKDENW